MLLKVIGAILVVGGASVIGFSARAKLSHRVMVLGELCTALDHMHTEISCMRTPTDELLEHLCNVIDRPLEFFFKDCLDEHKSRPDLPIAMIWSRALRDCEYLDLLPQEKSALEDVGNALGRYGADEQLHVIAHARRFTESFLKTACEAKVKLGKLYGGLSVMSGLAVVIMLF